MGQRKTPNGFGITWLLKNPKSFNIQTLKRVSNRFPEMPYRAQQKFLPRPFTQKNEPGFEQPIKGETGKFWFIVGKQQSGKPTQQKEPADDPRVAQVKRANCRIHSLRRCVNVYLMTFNHIVHG